MWGLVSVRRELWWVERMYSMVLRWEVRLCAEGSGECSDRCGCCLA